MSQNLEFKCNLPSEHQTHTSSRRCAQAKLSPKFPNSIKVPTELHIFPLYLPMASAERPMKIFKRHSVGRYEKWNMKCACPFLWETRSTASQVTGSQVKALSSTKRAHAEFQLWAVILVQKLLLPSSLFLSLFSQSPGLNIYQSASKAVLPASLPDPRS